VIEIRRTEQFIEWLDGLRDARAVAKIAARLKRVSEGNFGDCAPVGEGVSELRIHYGPGYRVYFVRRGRVVVVVLGGGDKSTQARDIELAKSLEKEL
jgi:putative addiction module killer protein